MAEQNAPRTRLDTPRDLRRQFIRRPTFGSDRFGRFAEGFARYMGTGQFLTGMTVFIITWVLWNTLTPGGWRFDPKWFILLNLIFSTQASYAAPLILLAQNRQESRDRVIAEQDRRVNAQAQADMEFLAREIASLRMALGEVATRDFVRSELRGLLAEMNERLDDLDDEGDDDRAEPAED